MTSKTYAVAVLIAVTATAWVGNVFATQPGNNGGGNGGCGVGQQTNGCGSQTPGNGGAGGQGGAGGNGTGIGLGVGIGHSSSNSSSSANSVSGSYSSGGDAKATGGNSNATGGAGGSASTNQAQSASGYGGSANGQGSGNTTSIEIAAPVIPKPAANSAYVGDLPQLPQGSCRLFIGGGATNRDGSATGMLPIGNDQTCISTRSLEVMKQINATVGQQVFGQADMLYVACQIEGMDKLAACKK